MYRILKPNFFKSIKKISVNENLFLKNIGCRYSSVGNDLEGTYVKTTIQRMNEEEGVDLQITAFDQYGFYINEKIRVLGPIVLFPKTIFSWNIADVNEINKNSLSLFSMLEPKLDILIIGTGSKSTKVDFEIPKWLIQNKITNFEILPTDKAIAAFNFLVAENRFVGAALVPAVTDQDVNKDVIERLERQKLYEDNTETNQIPKLQGTEKIKKAIEKAKEYERKNAIDSGDVNKK